MCDQSAGAEQRGGGYSFVCPACLRILLVTMKLTKHKKKSQISVDTVCTPAYNIAISAETMGGLLVWYTVKISVGFTVK